MSAKVPLSLCICTIDRPDLLRSALESVAAAQPQPAEVIVSDDSRDDETARLVADHFPEARYVRGPRQGGIGGNRRATVALVTQPHLAFIDDDATVPFDFFTVAQRIIDTNPDAVVTGRVTNHLPGGSQYTEVPNGANFLGFCTKPWNEGTSNMLTMSATVFPTSLFDHESFDGKLIYGYEEIDIGRRAVQRGYRVLLEPALHAHHFPQLRSDDYHSQADVSRIYSTWNFYRCMQRKRTKAAFYLVVASGHLMLKAVGELRVDALARAAGDVRQALRLVREG